LKGRLGTCGGLGQGKAPEKVLAAVGTAYLIVVEVDRSKVKLRKDTSRQKKRKLELTGVSLAVALDGGRVRHPHRVEASGTWVAEFLESRPRH
jgi:urocanate hydratase